MDEWLKVCVGGKLIGTCATRGGGDWGDDVIGVDKGQRHLNYCYGALICINPERVNGFRLLSAQING